ncbi:MAG: InlB B-repeat-containing protein [Oscillospiraceae bacterium]|jgi:uncharacterized repeat protein (TIGR02543 family)|nr:InlB B-repeat-containing protein [Oscillospiraceae bacterium]
MRQLLVLLLMLSLLTAVPISVTADTLSPNVPVYTDPASENVFPFIPPYTACYEIYVVPTVPVSERVWLGEICVLDAQGDELEVLLIHSADGEAILSLTLQAGEYYTLAFRYEDTAQFGGTMRMTVTSNPVISFSVSFARPLVAYTDGAWLNGKFVYDFVDALAVEVTYSDGRGTVAYTGADILTRTGQSLTIIPVTPGADATLALGENLISAWFMDRESTLTVTVVPQTEHVHVYQSTVIPPTHLAQGYTLHTCVEDGHTVKGQFTAATAHTFGAWVTTTPATETATGTETRTCPVDGVRETRPTPKLVHVHQYTVTVVPASCTASGYTRHTCTKGDHSYTDTPTAQKAHSFGAWNTTVAASISATGIAQRECSVCKNKETKTLAKLPSAIVQFDSHGGRAVASKTLAVPSAVGKLPTTTRTGYTFLGWTTAKTGGAKISDKTTVTKAATFHAQWQAKSFVVTYQTNGGKIASATSAKKTVRYAAKYALPAAPRRTGYTFAGWYTAKTGGSKITANSVVKLTKVQTLYARWTPIQYKVSFNANGGVAVAAKSIAYNTTIGALPTPKRKGYVFQGWYTAKSGGQKISKSTKVTKAVTYWAHWVK